MVIGAGLLFIGAVAFLPYLTAAGTPHLRLIHNPTLWDLRTRLPIVLTVVAAIALAFAVAGILATTPIPSLLATCCSFYLSGQFFPDGARAYNGTGLGFWLATGATIAMSIGGVLATASFANRFVKPS